jgi:hypothetical protein
MSRTRIRIAASCIIAVVAAMLSASIVVNDETLASKLAAGAGLLLGTIVAALFVDSLIRDAMKETDGAD